MRLLFQGGPWANRLIDSAVTTPPASVAPVGKVAGVYRRVEAQSDSPTVVYAWSPEDAEVQSRASGAGRDVGHDGLTEHGAGVPRPRERDGVVYGMRLRFALEVLGAVGALALAIVTLFSRDWIEIVFRFGPDQGSGALEWSVVFALLALSIGLTLVARCEWRHLTAST